MPRQSLTAEQHCNMSLPHLSDSAADPHATLPPGSNGGEPPAAASAETIVPSSGDSLSHPTIAQIGDYQLLEEIARGGMGVVYKARHVRLNRIAAVKLIKSGDLANVEDVRRFQVEAQAAAGLDHPGIVSVYEAGQEKGQHYIALAYVDGQSLWNRVKESPLPPNEAARIMEQVARAIHYAHEQGIIHRDLKPQNVMLTQDGAPKVTDFGLAKRRSGDSSLTATGQVLGTPSFMPPEQVGGKHGAAGPLADVYSLGATLYCLLTGRPPFQSASPMDTMLQVLNDEAVPPRQLNPSIPKDLETICLKCLQKEPRRRYATAHDLADDLSRWMNGQMISATQTGLVDQLMFALRHNRDDLELTAWARILSWFALIVPVTEFAVWLLWILHVENVHAIALLFRAVEFAAFAAILWSERASWWPPRTVAARHMLSQWIAFLAGCNLTVAVAVIAHHQTYTKEEFGIFTVYPVFAILSGVLWFSLGSNFWGFCYAIGAAFFGLSVVMPLMPMAAPIVFGLFWSACLWSISRRLKNLLQNESSGS